MEKLKDKLDELKLTNDEVTRLSEAFKKDEFKKLFREYAEELRDPENRKKYEEELRVMEMERGMDVEFINPKPGHVIKTIENSEKKAFINICQCDKIDKPSVKKSVNGNKRGATWSIPHSFSPPREDIDRKQVSCIVYDVVFSVNAYELGKKNERFRKMLHETALDGIENMFKVSLDKINWKLVKGMQMKGVPVATVIRRKREDYCDKQAELGNQKKDDPLRFPYPDIKETEVKHYSVNDQSSNPSIGATSGVEQEFTKPMHKVKYSNEFDMLNYVGGEDGEERIGQAMKPTKIIVEIKLPLISSANAIDLDIDRKNLKLMTMKPVKYLLELKLTYPVLSDMGTAKFDKSTKVLRLELPIEKTLEQSSEVTESLLSNIPNNLIEESPLNGNEIKGQLQDDASVLNNEIIEDIYENDYTNIDSSENCDIEKIFHTDSECIQKETARFDEIERTIPNVELKFRNNSTHAFLVCHIRNIDKSNCNYQWEPLSSTKYKVIITFSNCGQGGWKNFYKLPLTVDFKNEMTNFDSEIQCLISEESMVIRLPIQANSTFAESVAFCEQIFICKYDDPFDCLKTLDNVETICEMNGASETFQTAFGVVNSDTMKIICVPLNTPIDVENEFPKVIENNIEPDTKQNHHEINQEETDKYEEFIETYETNADIISEPQENIEKEYVKNEEDHDSTILPLNNIEAKRSLEHKNICCVELNSDLLFDLE